MQRASERTTTVVQFNTPLLCSSPGLTPFVRQSRSEGGGRQSEGSVEAVGGRKIGGERERESTFLPFGFGLAVAARSSHRSPSPARFKSSASLALGRHSPSSLSCPSSPGPDFIGFLVRNLNFSSLHDIVAEKHILNEISEPRFGATRYSSRHTRGKEGRHGRGRRGGGDDEPRATRPPPSTSSARCSPLPSPSQPASLAFPSERCPLPQSPTHTHGTSQSERPGLNGFLR